MNCFTLSGLVSWRKGNSRRLAYANLTSTTGIAIYAVQIRKTEAFRKTVNLLRLLLNEAMRLERATALQAQPYQRTIERRGYAKVLRPFLGQSALWPGLLWMAMITLGWVVGWFITRSAGIDLSHKWPVFGSTGAWAFQFLTGLALYFLLRSSQAMK